MSLGGVGCYQCSNHCTPGRMSSTLMLSPGSGWRRRQREEGRTRRDGFSPGGREGAMFCINPQLLP